MQRTYKHTHKHSLGHVRNCVLNAFTSCCMQIKTAYKTKEGSGKKKSSTRIVEKRAKNIMLPTHRRVTCDCCCSTNNADTPSFARYQRPNLQSHLPRCPPRCHICLILRAVLQQTRLVHFAVSFRVMFACSHV